MSDLPHTGKQFDRARQAMSNGGGDLPSIKENIMIKLILTFTCALLFAGCAGSHGTTSAGGISDTGEASGAYGGQWVNPTSDPLSGYKR
jgi:hypothetical protein